MMAETKPAKSVIVEKVYQLKERIRSILIPRTPGYFNKGGNGKGKIPHHFSLKDQCCIGVYIDEASPYKSAKRWHQTKNELINTTEKLIIGNNSLMAAVDDSDTKDEGLQLTEKTKDRLELKQIMTVGTGTITGTHLGPVVLGIIFFEDHKIKEIFYT